MKSLRLSIAVVAPVLLLGCSGQRTGKVSVLLKDAPGDLKTAVVTISEIDLVGSGGVIVLSNTEVTTDLLTLKNHLATLVQDAIVPSGTYSQLRFVITGAYIEVEQPDETFVIYATPGYDELPPGADVGGTLKTPSYAESGLKVDLPGGLLVGTDSKVLLVDFDVEQSFGHEAGDSESWVMHPVLTAMDYMLTGTLDVMVTLGTDVDLPPGATFDAVLTSSGETTTLPLNGPVGGPFSASFLYLTPGAHGLDFTASGLASFVMDPTVPTTVTITSGQLTTASFVVTSAN